MDDKLPNLRNGLPSGIVFASLALGCAGTSFADNAPNQRHSTNMPAERVVPVLRLTKPRLLTRAEILNADADSLARIGQHLMIGYHNFADVKALVERRAIAGVFITDHNVRRRPIQAIAAEIGELQGIRKRQGLPPLIIAADQEGGAVSRLSPPLARQPSIAAVLRGKSRDVEIEPIVRAYAAKQAAELNKVGVTLNFSPVVDLNFNPTYRGDGQTQLRNRAISSEPFRVAKVADWYCQGLADAGIACTLKHFPGLGRVKRDTHLMSAAIEVSEGKLELNDWLPFMRVMRRPHVAIMLAHVKINAIDKSAPASYSPKIIADLIRKKWNFRGLIITDDFSMGAITRSKDGVGGAAIKALNAGADIVLVSYSERHLDSVMSALLAADAQGALDRRQGQESFARLKRFVAPSEE